MTSLNGAKRMRREIERGGEANKQTNKQTNQQTETTQTRKQSHLSPNSHTTKYYQLL